jgi:membrane dipeptidase
MRQCAVTPDGTRIQFGNDRLAMLWGGVPVSVVPIVDGHLDLAENVTLFGRDLTESVAAIRAAEQGRASQATVSLPDLERGGIAVAVATVTAGFLTADVGPNFQHRSALYSTPEEAEAQALAQVALYQQWQSDGRVRLLLSASDLEGHLDLWQHDRRPGLVLLMEGADPIVQVDDLAEWWRRGVRIIGLTFGDTRYGSGVTGGSTSVNSGGLTDDGLELLTRMAELGIAWDVSHLTEQGIWQGLELKPPRVCASHANAQYLTPTDRHLSDAVIRAIAERDGVIGIVLYNGYLEPAWSTDPSIQVTIDAHVRRQVSHIAEIAGWAHVGIGSDLDGGFGLEETPQEIDTVADLHLVGSAAPAQFRNALLGENWLTFLRSALP